MKTLLIAAGIALVGAAAAAQAQTQMGEIPIHPALTDRFYFGAGVFFPKTSTEAQLTSRTGIGASINFEDSLGIKSDDTVPAGIVRWRFGQRWRLEAEYFQLNRSGEKVVDRDIQWGENVYPVNTNVQSKFDFSDLRVSVGYSFFKRTDKEIGVGLGLHVAAYDVALSTNAIGDEQQDVTAPLPVLSFYGQFALTERWAIGARLDRFSLSYENYDGSLSALGIDVQYQPFRHVGFGVGYRSLFIDLEAEKSGRTLKVEQSFQGPLLFMNVSF
jgi:hypothetical protein